MSPLSEPFDFDVIVVGGGPGGSVAAKKCAERGFRTLLLEKKRLPRDKVCTGMVMGPWAHRIIQEEFGDIPKAVLAPPYHLRGLMIHVPGVQRQVIEVEMPLAWRKDLDFWMNQGASHQGVVIWDGARATRVVQREGSCTVMVNKKGELREVRGGFVVGADGATSFVRRSLFPGMKVRYSAPLRQCYKGSLDIERDYVHWFFPRIRPRPRFDLHHKGDLFLVEGSGIRELGQETDRILEAYGFEPGTKPLWKDGCLVPVIHDALLSGVFTPALENVLLIGDAAGLFFPITYEGIGATLKSGLLAADAIAATTSPKKEVARIYLVALKSLLKQLKALHALQEQLEQPPTRRASDLSGTLKRVYEETLRVV